MEKLNVLINNKVVGYITKYNKYLFEYDDLWLRNGFSISPFSLPLKKGVFIPNSQVFNGFFGVFADSMPDSWGNLLLDRYLKKNSIDSSNGLIRLSIIGKNGMGALEYSPNTSLIDNFEFDLDEFQEEANHILNKQESNIDYLFKFGGSSGGARPKALIKYDDEDWIVKFQSRYDIDNIGICEYDYALACKEIGINIADVKLFESKTGKKFFGIKRFDRYKGKKIHMISVAALLEVDFNSPCLDYNEIFKLTKILTNNNKKDIEELFYRMCFNVYAHNLDDHAKNFSFLYDEASKTYRLSPAYDMTFSNTYYGEHTTSVNHKGKDISDSDLFLVGKKAILSDAFMNEAINKVKEVVNKRLNKYLK